MNDSEKSANVHEHVNDNQPLAGPTNTQNTFPAKNDDNNKSIGGESEFDVSAAESVGFNVSGQNVTVIEVCESDSGVESTPVFQRAFSCGYSSSDLNKSCDSSLLSYSEDTELMTQSLTLFVRDGTSEAGSESSVLESDKTLSTERKSAVKKKLITKSNKNALGSSLIAHTNNSTSHCRQNIIPNKYSSPINKKVEKVASPVPKSEKHFGAAAKIRSISNLETRNPTTPKDSPINGVVKKPISLVKPKIPAKPNFSSNTTPRTKVKATIATEYDGRWPSSSNRTPTPHAKSRVTPETKATFSKSNSIESNKVLDRFGTLPRRSRKRSPERSKDLVRSFSMNREQSVTRTRRNVRDISKTLPMFPRRKLKTRIFHEISVQTALTSSDVEKALAGMCIKEPRLDSIETKDREVQVDTSFEAITELELKLKTIAEENVKLVESVELQKESLQILNQQLVETTAAKESMKEELTKTDSRLLVMLGKVKEDECADNLQELETHLQSSGQIVIRQQKEIFHLQSINRTLQRDLDINVAARKELLSQQQEAEAESQEMQEFLLAEKTLLAEELRNAESEVVVQVKNVALKTLELERKQEECNHLVRISEQRRQENLTLQGRLNGLDLQSKDLLLQQGAAVSGASVALSGLSTRLEGLVDQLVSSYDISEQDLEDVIFHNEAYRKSNGSSIVSSPEHFHQPSPSPQRRASFLAAVLRAISNAASNMQHSTEPTADEIPVKEDAPVKEVLDEESSSTSRLVNSESLHNLSQAILRRKQFENGTEDLDSIEYELNNEMIHLPRGFTFIDQIIAVDNLVTKLLKVLRIIQLENDTNVDELQDERLQLESDVQREQGLRRNTQEEMRRQELVVARLRGEVLEAKLLLERREEELQTHRAFSDTQSQQLNCDDQMHVDVISGLKEQLAEKEMQLDEIQHKFSANKELLSQNLHQAANEIRRQYEAIDNALEILQSVQGVVQQCPPLEQLQRDLEETNFHCASSLPIVAADLNANAAPMSSNEIHNGGLDVVNNSGNVMSGEAY